MIEPRWRCVISRAAVCADALCAAGLLAGDHLGPANPRIAAALDAERYLAL